MPVDPNLLATTDETVTAAMVEKLNADLINQMGAARFCCAGAERAVSLSIDYEYYDKPDNLPDARSTVVCHPASPFYGPTYARGYWPELAALIEVLGRRIPNSTVWYGPDSADSVEQVTPEWLDEMWEFWSLHGSRTYHAKFKHLRAT